MAALLSLAAFRSLPTHPYPFPKLRYLPPMPVSAENPVTTEGATLGRYLFYDPILSRDSSISCGSCHRQEAAFSDAPHARSLGIDGHAGRRNTPPLFNLAWNERLFWDGRAVSLEAQVFEPVRAHQEMDLDWPTAVRRLSEHPRYRTGFMEAFGTAEIDSMTVAKAIAQFERTLISCNAPLDKALAGGDTLGHDALEGFLLMNDQSKGACLHCHPTDAHSLGTNGGFGNNGLPIREAGDFGRENVTGNPQDRKRFKVPSLRNLGFTAPYMHDGRFATLEEVLTFYTSGVEEDSFSDNRMQFAHRGGHHLTDEENCQILAFLHALDDSTFVRDSAFSDPFRRH